MHGVNDLTLRHVLYHERPIEPNALKEYYAFQRMKQNLPVAFHEPPADHMVYDYVVQGKKWQLKLARYRKQGDVYGVNCYKNAGKVAGKSTLVQYELDDFDFLCVQMPVDTVNCCYILPQRELHRRGLLGDATKGDGHINVYPHRQLTSNKKVHNKGVHWTEAFRIDFDENVAVRLSQVLATS